MNKNLILNALLVFMFFTMNAQNWNTNLDLVKKIAFDENKNIILVFQGSDWCAPCIKLDREIWSTTEFKNYAKENFVLLKADFPRKRKNQLSEIQKEKNKKLMEQYNPRGYFPFVVVLDKNGKALGTTGYKKTTPTAYVDLLTSF